MLHCQQVLGIAPIVLHWRAHESKATPAQWRPNFHYFGIFGQFLKPDWRQWVAWLSPDLSKDCFEHLGPGAARLRISKKKNGSVELVQPSTFIRKTPTGQFCRWPHGLRMGQVGIHVCVPLFIAADPAFETGQLRNTSYNLDGSSLSTIP